MHDDHYLSWRKWRPRHDEEMSPEERQALEAMVRCAKDGDGTLARLMCDERLLRMPDDST